MDYQGNYFPEEQDENSSKTYRVVKGIFKWTMYGISFLLYAVLFVILFINRDSKILEKNYMAELSVFDGVDTDDIDLYRINTRDFMNEIESEDSDNESDLDPGSLQVYNVDYSDEYGVIEIGIKFNANKLTGGDNGDALEYVLTDSQGNTYPLVHRVTDSGGRYGFARICFSGLDIDLDSNDLRYEEGKTDIVRTDVSYKLAVSKKSDGHLLYEFNIYDNTVTFGSTDYED